jgi:hypothetical protein
MRFRRDDAGKSHFIRLFDNSATRGDQYFAARLAWSRQPALRTATFGCPTIRNGESDALS